MAMLPQNVSGSLSIAVAPTIDDVKKIVAIAEPALRNLQITNCYSRLSAAFAKRTGPMANWCTFATWASKQAGQTIRRNDLNTTLEALLKKEQGAEEAFALIASLAKDLGALQSPVQLQKSSVNIMVQETANRAADAVSRGNKKVFEEIGYEFARFLACCSQDAVYSQQTIESFTRNLHVGDAPAGQALLQKAFANYYQAMFEQDAKKKMEVFLLANLQIGLHEQTRLQPEITEALNASLSNKEAIKQQILSKIFEDFSYLAKMRIYLQRFFGKTDLLDKAVEELVVHLQKKLRVVLTAHLMTLTMPPDSRLQLGRDLLLNYQEDLKTLSYPGLVQFLLQVDPTPDSLRETGATDWADLKERMHFIADLFRCYHLKTELFTEPFTLEQVKAMEEGRLPGGNL